MKDLKNFIIEAKKKVKNISNDDLKYDILGLAEDEEELSNVLDSWFDNHNKSDIKLYLDHTAATYFKTEKLNYEFTKINKDEINDILDILKKDGKKYSTNYIGIIINDDIIYSKTPDGTIIIK